MKLTERTMAKKTLYIPAEENELIIKYNKDDEAYEIEEKHILAALTDSEMDNTDTILKALKNIEISASDAAKIILAVIGKVINETEYQHEAMLLKAAKAYCNSIKNYHQYGY